MRRNVSKSQTAIARNVNLASYLTDTYPNAFILDPDTHKLCYLERQPIYRRIDRNDNGSDSKIWLTPPLLFEQPIDFLMQYLRYDFVEAVQELCRYAGKVATAKRTAENEKSMNATATASRVPLYDYPVEQRQFKLPPVAAPPYRQIFGNMVYHKIPYEEVKRLVKQGLLYQSGRNAVFVSKNRDYYEEVGTISYRRYPYFHFERKNDAAYWSVRNSPEPIRHICICATAMDAVSLMILREKVGLHDSSAYCSIGSVDIPECTAVVDRIIHDAFRVSPSTKVFLAFSKKDLAKLQGKKRYALDAFLPTGDSWNDDLMKGVAFFHPIYAYPHAENKNPPKNESP